MNTSSRSRRGGDNLSALIRDQLRDRTNRQFLTRLPMFRPDEDTDEVFAEYLTRLDCAERTAR